MGRKEIIHFQLLRSGIVCGELFPTDAPPMLTMDRSGEIKMSMQGEFFAQAIDTRGRPIEVEWTSDEIKPVLVSGETEHELGILMPASVTNNETETTETVTVQAFDRCWRLRDTKIKASYFVAAGTLYLDVIESLITAAGIPNILRTDSDAVIPEDREDWQTGTSYLTIVNELLAEINYEQLWFNPAGLAVLEPKMVPIAQNIKHVFTDRKHDPRNSREAHQIQVAPQITRMADFYSAPNVFVCICSNADKSAGMRAIAENRNPQSPLSISRRGREIVSVVSVKNIASQTALQTYANNLLSSTMISGEVITVQTPLLPGFGVDEPVAISAKSVDGICIEKAWTAELKAGGTMTHTLERVVLNLDI